MAFKFMNNYFYGRAGKKDFTEADLPTNRYQLFRDVLKVRWSNMVSLNLIYLLIWIPATVWTVMNAVLVITPTETGEMVDVAAYLAPYLLILFPLIFITGPFNIGASYVARNWARDEHAFVWGDFKDAMKQNWKQALLFSLIEGAIPMVMIITVRFYLQLSADTFIFFIPAGILLIVGILWKLSALLLPTMIVTYDQKFSMLVRNALIISMATLPRAVGIKLASLAVPIVSLALVMLIPSAASVVVPVATCLYGVFMLAFNKLMIASYANFACEKYLNSRIEGARTNIGLRPDIK